MPLFGSKHKHDHDHHDSTLDNRHSATTHGTHGTHGTHAHGAAGELPPAGAVGGGVGVPMGSAAGMTQTYPGTGTQGSSLTGGTGHAGATNDPYTAGGVGHTGYSTASGPGGAIIPPTSDLNHRQHNPNTHGAGTNAPSGGGTGTRLTGKVESALGSALGSSALKAKGMEKEREANAVKLQSQELAEAERLEKEALLRRERAVGHGAHPANSALGAGGMGGTTGHSNMNNSGTGY
ncbi:hypothetical protein CPB83DRAFT_188894 [Crepidotus variabilis]|uniref:Uncharacterized protein n=1 Tax=Crepidotus variabilis TaxID=179855 RepID=A0A9P6EJF5_9AGAR|nr:hypothetical protein CPB83DRAFT_188894 [Crepidotus variabilis]